MTYQEATQYLFNQTANFEKQGVKGYKPGLDSMKALDALFGHPHTLFRSIHVGGTNGKGSVSHMLAALLQVCGYKVGLYTSPHLVDFRERIRVNGQPISEEYVVEFVEAERQFFESLKASFFEITTAMAFKYFSEQGVDIAVVEVGLGGRLDSTNIISPILSVITNVSLDHTQLLGKTLSAIATEKAGIMKEGVPCVVGETTAETRPVFEAIAQKQDTRVVFAEDMPLVTPTSQLPGDRGQRYISKSGMEFTCELMGEFQAKNVNTVAHATHILLEQGYLCHGEVPKDLNAISDKIQTALMNVTSLTGLMGRWQQVSDNPTIICDTGHNPGAWQYLSRMLEQERQRSHELRIVYGALEDKDVQSILTVMPKEARYYWTKADNKRAMSEMSLKELGEQSGLHGECYPTVERAIKAATDDAQTDDFIFVGGSTYVVAEFLKTRV